MTTEPPAQLVLDLGHRPALGRADFLVSQCNAEAVAWVDRWPDWPAPGLVIWGRAASGKSHLGQVWQARIAAPMISAAELPSFERVPMETPTPLNELGAKGIGEAGSVGSTPAVQNAVIDALSHLGIRHLDMPATPERVWRAIMNAGEAIQ